MSDKTIQADRIYELLDEQTDLDPEIRAEIKESAQKLSQLPD